MRLTELKLVRLRRGLLQVDVARESGIRSARLSALENGHDAPREHELRRLGAVLGVPVSTLTTDATEPAARPAA